MKNHDLLTYGDTLFRVLEVEPERLFVIDCGKKSMPKWIRADSFSEEHVVTTDPRINTADINGMEPDRRRIAHERFTMISPILPFILNKKRRCSVIEQIAAERGISSQTVAQYLWLYLAHQNIAALAPKEPPAPRELTADEKNFRWALNKFFYTRYGHTLTMTYTLMLKEKYCDKDGVLLPDHPSFYQLRYFYRTHFKAQNYHISRMGMSHYRRNHRPLLGDGVQAFAPSIGVGMLDSTICDIYLVNEAGGIVGRPILTACVDAYSGLCCGYSLSWEGGVYSLRGLMANIIADKQEWCARFGIAIEPADWNCRALPATLVTDMGKEYTSDTFEQISELGVTLINLPAYRPELKGVVEKFFDVLQGLYKPHLRERGVVEADSHERGVKDYRRDARLTMEDFERVILHCIIYYNSQRVLENFPYTDDMVAANVQPHTSDIWNYALTDPHAHLIPVDYDTLILTLLPRTTAKFTRKGLVCRKLRYKNAHSTEKFLTGGDATVAYNPEDTGTIWTVEDGTYTPYTLIESRYKGMDIQEIDASEEAVRASVGMAKKYALQAKIDLAEHIETIASASVKRSRGTPTNIRENRTRERRRTRVDYVRRRINHEED